MIYDLQKAAYDIEGCFGSIQSYAIKNTCIELLLIACHSLGCNSTHSILCLLSSITPCQSFYQHDLFCLLQTI